MKTHAKKAHSLTASVMRQAPLPIPSRCGGRPQTLPRSAGPHLQRHRAQIREILYAPHLQPKLKIGAPDDAYEREADRVADRVMRMPEPVPEAERTPPVRREEETAIQRLCPECKEEVRRQPMEEEEFVQTKAVPGCTPEVSPGLASRIQALRGGGRPLPDSARAFFGPRFGHDFSDVRIHVDAPAAEAAKAVNARAFTVGHDIVFGAGMHAPETNSGKRLLAHELTHVLQQRGSPERPVAVQRKVVVEPNNTAANDILDQFKILCPSGTFGLSGKTITERCKHRKTRSCQCLCDTARTPKRTYTITVHNVTDSPRSLTLHDGTTVPNVPFPSVGPSTVVGSNPSIDMPASSGPAIEFGAFRGSGKPLQPISVPNWRILAHELCGHGWLKQSSPGSKGNRPGHDTTIHSENRIAAEHGGKTRGYFSSKRQGESFHFPAGNPSKLVFKLKDGWHFEAP